MTTNVRLLPPITVSTQTLTVNGRKYSAQPGSTLDVPDFDARVLTSNGWLKVEEVGASTARPSAPAAGKKFFDSTLNATISWDGAHWRDPATGNAV